MVLVPGLGLFGIGRTAKDADMAADLAENTVRVVTDAEGIGRYQPLPEGDLFELEYWSLEQAKLKGAVVKHLADKVEAPVYFIDDIPPNIASVAKACEKVHCLHFVHDERLGNLLGPAENSRHRADTWPEAAAWLTAHMEELGY